MTDYHDKGADSCGQLWHNCTCDEENEIARLQSQLAIAVAALEQLSSWVIMFKVEGGFWGKEKTVISETISNPAKEALERIKEMGK